jgi:hypothetical protein
MCPATIFKVIWNYLIFGIPHYGIYIYLYMELLYIFIMELVLVEIYLSVKSLRKTDDYQWNTLYFVFILERLPRYIDNQKELGHGLGYGPNTDLHD